MAQQRNSEVGTDTVPAGNSSIGLVVRIMAMAAAAVPTIIGLIALARLHWADFGMDAPAVGVADISFRPWIAIATTAIGVICLVAAATWDRESKIVVGGLVAAAGVAVLVAHPSIQQVALTDRLGWMFVAVGAVLIIAGLLVGSVWSNQHNQHNRRTRHAHA
jgi:hypothetical protein